MSRFRGFNSYLWKPDSVLYLVAARLFWSTVILYEFFKMYQDNWNSLDYRFYTHAFHMKYYYMEWIPDIPSSAVVMHVLVYIWAICAVLIAVGFYYYEAMFTFFVLFSYHYFSTEENYLNHHWVIICITLSLSILPAGASYSIDAWRFTGDWRGARYVPRWVRWYLALHLDCVYIYGSVAKINVDWLRASPIYNWVWFKHTRTYAWLEPLYDWWFFPYIISYGGIFWDGLAPILLRLPGWFRLPGLLGSLFFHGFNRHQFGIGVFPYMSTALTTLYFPSDWPAHLYRYTVAPLVQIVNELHIMLAPMRALEDVRVPSVEEEEHQHEMDDDDIDTEPLLRRRKPVQNRERRRQIDLSVVERNDDSVGISVQFDGWSWKAVFAICLLLAAFQILMPMRHHFAPHYYTHSPAWSDEGHQFSWRMKLRDRHVTGRFYITVHFLATNETTSYTYHSSARDRRPGRVELNGKVLERGIAQTSRGTWKKFTSRPSALRRYAHYLQKFTVEDYHLFHDLEVEVDVRGEFYSELNFRPPALIISPETPLCDPELSWWGSEWIEPEPYMPDHYRYQYPWVFLPMLLWGDDNPCTPWHGIQKTRKIEDAINLMGYFVDLDAIYAKREEKHAKFVAFEEYRAEERVELSKSIIDLCAEWDLSINDGDCQEWAASGLEASSATGPEAEAQAKALTYFTDLRSIIEEGWVLNRIDDNGQDNDDMRSQEEDLWKDISMLAHRWNRNVTEIRTWATDITNEWFKAQVQCEDFSENHTYTPAVWEYFHGGFASVE